MCSSDGSSDCVMGVIIVFLKYAIKVLQDNELLYIAKPTLSAETSLYVDIVDSNIYLFSYLMFPIYNVYIYTFN